MDYEAEELARRVDGRAPRAGQPIRLFEDLDSGACSEV
jgi:hypothetical protein